MSGEGERPILSRRRLLLLLVLLLALAVRVPLLFFGDAGLPRFSDERFLVLSAVEVVEGLSPLGVLTYPGGPVLLLTMAACVGAFLLSHLGEVLAALFTADLDRVLRLYELYFLEFYAAPARTFVAARLVALAGGLATVACAARFGRRWAGEGAGLAAAAFLALWPVHIRLSTEARVDVWIGLFLLLALDEALAAASDGERSVLPLALWSALLFTTKNNTGVLLPVILYCLWRGAARGRRLRRAAVWLGATALFGVVACPWLLADTTLVVKETVRTYTALPDVGRSVGWASQGPAALGIAVLGAFGPVLLALVAAGAVLWGRRRPMALAVALWTPVLVLVAMAWMGVYFSYYVAPPAVPLLAGAGLVAVEAGRLAARGLRRPGGPGAVAAVLLLCLLMAPGPAGLLARGGGPRERAAARDWIESHVPEGAAVLRNVDVGLRPHPSALVRDLEWLERRYFREETPLPVPVAVELFALDVQYRIHAARHLLRADEAGLLEGRRYRTYRFEWGFVTGGALESLRGGETCWVVTTRGKREALERGRGLGLDPGAAAEVSERIEGTAPVATFGDGSSAIEIYRLGP